MNSKSIGIEIVNCGAGTPGNGCGDDSQPWGIDPYSDAQVAAVDRLVNYLMDKYGIHSDHILGHGCVTTKKYADEPAGFPDNFANWQILRRGESPLCGGSTT
jgi:N-acetyl-anhydromuramyl-L-alanine amidase AmpD